MGKRTGSSKIRLETVWCGAEFDWESVGVDPVLFGNLLVLSKISLGECACRATFDWKIVGAEQNLLAKVVGPTFAPKGPIGFFLQLPYGGTTIPYEIPTCNPCVFDLCM